MELADLLRSLKPEELRFIAERDYGEDADTHLAELHKVVQAGGQFREGQYWHPYEVIELGAHSLVTGHEREFAICTLLVIAAVASGFDTSTDLAAKLADRTADYDKLEPTYRESVLSAYAAAGL
jgi:hypothetical protein